MQMARWLKIFKNRRKRLADRNLSRPNLAADIWRDYKRIQREEPVRRSSERIQREEPVRRSRGLSTAVGQNRAECVTLFE